MKKFNIIFHGSIILFSIASLIISFVTLSKIDNLYNQENGDTTMYVNSTENNKILAFDTVQTPINLIIETNNAPVSVTRGGRYPFILKDEINNTYITAECIDISGGVNNSIEYSPVKQKYNVTNYSTSPEKATVFSGNYTMIEYTIDGIREGKYQLIGVKTR